MIMEFPSNSDYVIGVDEVGRGPLAGPVVVAAVLADKSIMELEVKDSKLISAKKRLILMNEISKKYKFAVVSISASDIDKINILNATKKAMNLAISELKIANDCDVFVDGNFTPYNDDKITSIIKGDQRFKPISAASIIAKEVRDSMMCLIAKQHPEYDWHKNMGYGTKAHLDALKLHGITPFHRLSFLKNLDLHNGHIAKSI